MEKVEIAGNQHQIKLMTSTKCKYVAKDKVNVTEEFKFVLGRTEDIAVSSIKPLSSGNLKTWLVW